LARRKARRGFDRHFGFSPGNTGQAVELPGRSIVWFLREPTDRASMAERGYLSMTVDAKQIPEDPAA
jgi:hypothetical protein